MIVNLLRTIKFSLLLAFLFSSLTIEESPNANYCAKSLGRQPSSPEECLADVSNPLANCCYLKLSFLGSSVSACYPFLKAKSPTAEEMAFQAGILGGNIESYTCSANQINQNVPTVDIANFNFTPSNLCSISINRQPANASECVIDKSIPAFDCCYLSGKDKNNKTFSMCNFFPQTNQTIDYGTYLKNYLPPRLGINLENFSCNNSAFIKFSMISILVFIGLIF